MSERKSTGTDKRRPSAARTAEKVRDGAPDRVRRTPPATDRDPMDVTWDQPQPRYPAPERPLDRAEERKA